MQRFKSQSKIAMQNLGLFKSIELNKRLQVLTLYRFNTKKVFTQINMELKQRNKTEPNLNKEEK